MDLYYDIGVIAMAIPARLMDKKLEKRITDLEAQVSWLKDRVLTLEKEIRALKQK